MVGRWYMVNRDCMATLCTDREDAEKEAVGAQIVWPRNGPHRAAQASATSLLMRIDLPVVRLRWVASGRCITARPAGGACPQCRGSD